MLDYNSHDFISEHVAVQDPLVSVRVCDKQELQLDNLSQAVGTCKIDGVYLCTKADDTTVYCIVKNKNTARMFAICGPGKLEFLNILKEYGYYE